MLFVNVHNHDDDGDDGDSVVVLSFPRLAQSPKNILRAQWYHFKQKLNWAEGISIGPDAQALKGFHYTTIVKRCNVSHNIGNKKVYSGVEAHSYRLVRTSCLKCQHQFDSLKWWNIYIMEISKHYKLGSFFLRDLIVNNLLAQDCIWTVQDYVLTI